MLKSIYAKKELIVDLVILALITLFIFSYFSPGLLLLKTTINGGDTGSHYPNAVYLKDVLLPHGKIMGWMQGNYAGYPLFYHYFPLPFLLMAFLSFILSMEVSFKLITILGTLLLPFCIYFSFRALKYDFPIPGLAAIFSLAFLFNQGNSMWGGNIPSTLAGEFCYSLGVAWVFLLIGTLRRGVKEQRYVSLNALLIFLTGLSHAYTLIFALIIGSYFLISNFKQNIKYLFIVYGLGFLLLAFWLLPVLGNAPYTTSFVFRWTVSSLFEVFPVLLIPFTALSIFAIFLNRKDEKTVYFLYLILACVFVYLAGPHFGILDIRFVPFFQLLLTIFGATSLNLLARELKAPSLLPFMVIILVALWVTANATYIRSWITWNYRGYEQKNTWPVFKEITGFLKQNDHGRVEWEHHPADEALGSIRTYETLPYFAKRQTLEGIHMLGAISAPFVFYIESETSYQPCNPLPDYFYSTFDLNGGREHFKLFNVSQFVVRSDQVKEAIKSQPEFLLQKTVDKYNIYRLTTNSGAYVEPLKNEPVLFLTKDWRDISYQWFARRDRQSTFLVFRPQADQKDRAAFRQVVTALEQIKPIPYPDKKLKVSSRVKDESIEIETSELGRPLLVKVSYHPNWQVKGAERVYLVSPCFMLIIPRSHKITLTFEPSPLNHIGLGLTLIGLIMLCLSPYWFKKTAAIGPAGQGQWLAIILIAVIAITAFFLFEVIRPGPTTIMNKAHSAFNRGDFVTAQRLFAQVVGQTKKDSGPRNEAAIFYATCFVRENKFAEGKNELQAFIKAYPNSFWTPQAYFDLAYCQKNLGDTRGAGATYHQIIRDFPITTWAKYSQERLKELNQ